MLNVDMTDDEDHDEEDKTHHHENPFTRVRAFGLTITSRAVTPMGYVLFWYVNNTKYIWENNIKNSHEEIYYGYSMPYN